MTPESFNEALIECVKAAGGSKDVAVSLWGKSQGVEVVQRRLLACLNTERPEKLTTEEIFEVMRLARLKGYHGAVRFICKELSYTEPSPIEPKDEADDLRRQVLELGSELRDLFAKLERLERPGPRAVGA